MGAPRGEGVGDAFAVGFGGTDRLLSRRKFIEMSKNGRDRAFGGKRDSGR